MFLTRLNLSYFKNYTTRTFSFGPKVNALAGNNGVGKTNLMDAIHYLCMTKSYFNVFDFQNVNHNSDFFRLEGEFQTDQEVIRVVCKVVNGKKKVFEVNDQVIPKLAAHIGRLNVIFIAPDDNVIILGGSEERRKFIDNTISQIDHPYLSDLLQYNKALKHRNALLKKFSASGSFDRALLHTFNDRLVRHGLPVYEKRKQLFSTLGIVLNQYYARLSGSLETVSMSYVSKLHDEHLENLLLMNEEKDRILQRTSSGIHKDDVAFEMDGFKIKKFSSQGQQKSFLLALKFAQFEVIKNAKNEAPILLIDDIFDKLDVNRSGYLLDLISQPPFNQVFITDTNRLRIERIFGELSTDIRIFDI